ncbi:hypothetical protein JNW88_04365 [Micromonospora sp. ATA32]|nr:hypothetical protein [Micromonospora sp. ATA32]
MSGNIMQLPGDPHPLVRHLLRDGTFPVNGQQHGPRLQLLAPRPAALRTASPSSSAATNSTVDPSRTASNGRAPV